MAAETDLAFSLADSSVRSCHRYFYEITHFDTSSGLYIGQQPKKLIRLQLSSADFSS